MYKLMSDDVQPQTKLVVCVLPGLIRLVNGPATNYGFVQVFVNGVWGAVCANSYYSDFLSANAAVVCRQLGLPTAGAHGQSIGSLNVYSPLYTRYVGPGSSGSVPYVMSLVQCSGLEGQIFDCPRFVNGAFSWGLATNPTWDCTNSDLGA